MNYPNWDLQKIDTNWTLFLDRDGVINYEKKDDYIRNKEEFRFYEGVPEAVANCSRLFGKIFIVTNQRGIGKGLMTENDLVEIHQYMCQEIASVGGKIDHIYYCTAINNNDPNRKPNPGMAFQAKKDFPSIDFSKSIMVGNKPSDMLFGRNAGMYTVYVSTTHPETPFPHPDIDGRWISLPEFAKALMKS